VNRYGMRSAQRCCEWRHNSALFFRNGNHPNLSGVRNYQSSSGTERSSGRSFDRRDERTLHRLSLKPYGRDMLPPTSYLTIDSDNSNAIIIKQQLTAASTIKANSFGQNSIALCHPTACPQRGSRILMESYRPTTLN